MKTVSIEFIKRQTMKYEWNETNCLRYGAKEMREKLGKTILQVENTGFLTIN